MSEAARVGAAPERHAGSGELSVAVCGTYRKDLPTLRSDYDELRRMGCRMLSPVDVEFVAERDGFVLAEHEVDRAPSAVEEDHLDAMRAADFVWLHAPDGYVGRSAAMELGYAGALGLTVFARTAPREPAFEGLVRVVASPAAAVAHARQNAPVVPASLTTLQHYYMRVARQRGWDHESARDCLLLMTEEVGELARAVRKAELLQRDKSYASDDVGAELADVQLYLVHLANVLEINLAEAVAMKERINAARFAERDVAEAA